MPSENGDDFEEFLGQANDTEDERGLTRFYLEKCKGINQEHEFLCYVFDYAKMKSDGKLKDAIAYAYCMVWIDEALKRSSNEKKGKHSRS